MFPTSTPEYKKSFENDAQSSDNINFLKVQWSSLQLPTVRRKAGPGLVGEGRVHACVGARGWGVGMSEERVFALFGAVGPIYSLLIHLMNELVTMLLSSLKGPCRVVSST